MLRVCPHCHEKAVPPLKLRRFIIDYFTNPLQISTCRNCGMESSINFHTPYLFIILILGLWLDYIDYDTLGKVLTIFGLFMGLFGYYLLFPFLPLEKYGDD